MSSLDHESSANATSTDCTTTYSKLFFHNLTNLRPSVAPIKELKGPVGQIQHIDRLVLAVEQVSNLTLRLQVLILPQTTRGHTDQRSGYCGSSRKVPLYP